MRLFPFLAAALLLLPFPVLTPPAGAAHAWVMPLGNPQHGSRSHTGSHHGSSGPRAGSSSPKVHNGSQHKSSGSYKAPSHRSTGAHTPKTGSSARSSGKIHRSKAATDAFKRQTGYPHGRPGYVIDHKVPLACGGADDPGNMQWQTKAEARAKDKVERKGCGKKR